MLFYMLQGSQYKVHSANQRNHNRCCYSSIQPAAENHWGVVVWLCWHVLWCCDTGRSHKVIKLSQNSYTVTYLNQFSVNFLPNNMRSFAHIDSENIDTIFNIFYFIVVHFMKSQQKVSTGNYMFSQFNKKGGIAKFIMCKRYLHRIRNLVNLSTVFS